MTELQTPTFDIFKQFLGEDRFNEDCFNEDSFNKIETWLKNGHYYLEKKADLENYKCEESDDIKGFDVPVLIKSHNGNNKKLMIIVGESPLRNGTEKGLLVGFPFAVDYENEPPRCAVYKKLFNELLANNYDLYITDIIKVWEKKNNKLTVEKKDIDILNKELEILSKEYADIHILLMGSNAKKWKINGEDYKCINIPHMSQRNWDTWRIKIYEDAFRKLINDGKITKENIEGLVEEDANKLEFCSMNAGTVANTAFKMISSELEKMIK